MAKKKESKNGTTALRKERAKLPADGGDMLPEAVIAGAEAAANASVTPPAEPDAPEPQPQQDPAKDDPIAKLLEQASGAIKFARSQMTPPKSNPKGKSRAEKFEVKADLKKAADEVQGWIEIVPSIIEIRGKMDANKCNASIAAFERAFKRLESVLDELTVRRCEANVDSIEKGLSIIGNPKWKGQTPDLTDVKKVLADLKRVVRTRRPFPRVNERGDEAARSLWGTIEGRCYTCGSELPCGFHGRFCNPCHKAFLAEKRQAEQKADADLLAELRQQMKKP